MATSPRAVMYQRMIAQSMQQPPKTPPKPKRPKIKAPNGY